MEINRINYEKYFLLYLDRELNPSEIQEVEKFLQDNTDLQKEFLQLEKTVFVPEEIVFENKELLLRKEEKRRVIPFYRMRIAAAVAGLILGSWFIISQTTKNPNTTAANDQASKMKTAPTKPVSGTADKSVDSPGQKVNKNSTADRIAGSDIQEKMVREKRTDQVDLNYKDNPNEGIKDQNKMMTKNNRKPANDQNIPAAGNNQNGYHGLSAMETNNIPEESSLAVQKSSAGVEIQAASGRVDNISPLASSRPGDKAPALLMTAGAKTEAPGSKDDLVWKETDFQSDNAISVVALNDQNKGISKFFKKLTRRTPEADNAKKIRVSVFQFSY